MIEGRRAYRRHLPHYQSDRRSYFVTFVTQGRWELPPAARTIVLSEITVLVDVQVHVHVAVVMPDHVHIILMPLWNEHGEFFVVSEILRRIKGRSARRINIALSRSGPVWQPESFDHETARGRIALRQD